MAKDILKKYISTQQAVNDYLQKKLQEQISAFISTIEEGTTKQISILDFQIWYNKKYDNTKEREESLHYKKNH